MRILVLGSTGTLGQSLLRMAKGRGIVAVGAARRGADHNADLADHSLLVPLFDTVKPDAVVNCAAITDLNACETAPEMADRINAKLPGEAAALTQKCGARFVQVSTDHYFSGDRDRLHDERAPVTLLNEYARSKYKGESLALEAAGTLAVRTNLTGWRGWDKRPTFAEWAAGALRGPDPVTGFSDYFISTIDSDSLASSILDLLAARAEGLLNVSSSEVADKASFLRAMAKALGEPEGRVKDGSVASLTTPRAESLGLDVRKAEGILGYRLPGLNDVVTSLVRTMPHP